MNSLNGKHQKPLCDKASGMKGPRKSPMRENSNVELLLTSAPEPAELRLLRNCFSLVELLLKRTPVFRGPHSVSLIVSCRVFENDSNGKASC
jgi:hypothetical protein